VKKKSHRDQNNHDRDIANEAVETALEVVDEAVEDGETESIGHVMMLMALSIAQEAAAETLIDKAVESVEKRKKRVSDREFDRLVDQLTEKVDSLPPERLCKVFMELMGEVLSRQTKGRYRVQIIEVIDPKDDKDKTPRRRTDPEEE